MASYTNRGISVDINATNVHTKVRDVLPRLSLNKSLAVTVPGSIFYNTTDKTPYYSDGLNLYPFGGSAVGGNVVVFRPGYTGPRIVNVFSTFPEAYDAISKLAGLKWLCLDPQDVLPGPIIIPPGSYDLDDVSLVAPFKYVRWTSFSSPIINVQIQEGVTISNLNHVRGPYSIEYQGTSGPCITIPNGAGGLLFMEAGVRIYCTGGREFIRVGQNSDYEVVCGIGCGFQKASANGNSNVLFCEDNVQFLILMKDCQSNLDDDTLGGTLNSTVIVIKDCLEIFMSVPLVQTPVLGTLVLNDIYANTPNITRNGGPPGPLNDDTQGRKTGDLWIDTSGPAAYIAVDVTTGLAVWNLL